MPIKAAFQHSTTRGWLYKRVIYQSLLFRIWRAVCQKPRAVFLRQCKEKNAEVRAYGCVNLSRHVVPNVPVVWGVSVGLGTIWRWVEVRTDAFGEGREYWASSAVVLGGWRWTLADLKHTDGKKVCWCGSELNAVLNPTLPSQAQLRLFSNNLPANLVAYCAYLVIIVFSPAKEFPLPLPADLFLPKQQLLKHRWLGLAGGSANAPVEQSLGHHWLREALVPGQIQWPTVGELAAYISSLSIKLYQGHTGICQNGA